MVMSLIHSFNGDGEEHVGGKQRWNSSEHRKTGSMLWKWCCQCLCEKDIIMTICCQVLLEPDACLQLRLKM